MEQKLELAVGVYNVNNRRYGNDSVVKKELQQTINIAGEENEKLGLSLNDRKTEASRHNI